MRTPLRGGIAASHDGGGDDATRRFVCSRFRSGSARGVPGRQARPAWAPRATARARPTSRAVPEPALPICLFAEAARTLSARTAGRAAAGRRRASPPSAAMPSDLVGSTVCTSSSWRRAPAPANNARAGRRAHLLALADLGLLLGEVEATPKPPSRSTSPFCCASPWSTPGPGRWRRCRRRSSSGPGGLRHEVLVEGHHHLAYPPALLVAPGVRGEGAECRPRRMISLLIPTLS